MWLYEEYSVEKTLQQQQKSINLIEKKFLYLHRAQMEDQEDQLQVFSN